MKRLLRQTAPVAEQEGWPAVDEAEGLRVRVDEQVRAHGWRRAMVFGQFQNLFVRIIQRSNNLSLKGENPGGHIFGSKDFAGICRFFLV